jgi:hypothetical protein
MVWPFGKRTLKAQYLPIPDGWAVMEGERNGLPVILRCHAGYRAFKGVAGYEYQVGIVVPLCAPEPSGLPSSPEVAELDQMEDAICSALEAERESLFVAVISTGGMREFVFYTRDPEQVKLKFEQLRASIKTHRIQLMIQPDKDWAVFARQTQRRK